MSFKVGDFVISRRFSKGNIVYRIRKGIIVDIYMDNGNEIIRIQNEGKIFQDYSFDWELDVEEIRDKKINEIL